MRILALLVVAAAACGSGHPGGMSGPSMNNHMGAEQAPPVSRVVSADILAREPVANTVKVKHILIGWKDLADNYDGHIDSRAAARTKAEAEAQVEMILAQLKAGGDFDGLMKGNSEDRGSAASGQPFEVTPAAGFVIEFKQLGLRLNVDEIGVCESQFGFHIMKRVE